MRRLLLFIMVLVLLMGCTMKATYNRLDWIAAKYLGSYVELSKDQKNVLRRQLAETLDWHRTTQLPAYAQWLSSLQHEIPHGLSEEQVDRYGLELQAFWQSLMLRLADDLSVLLPRLTTEQRVAIFSRLDRDNSTRASEVAALNLEKQQNDYARRLKKGLNRWLGELNDEQNELIRTAANNLQSTESESLGMRVRFQQTIRLLLDKEVDSNELRAALEGLLIRDTNSQNSVYEQKIENNRRVLTRLIARLSFTMNEGQRDFLNQRINKYIKLFNDLARQGNKTVSSSCASC